MHSNQQIHTQRKYLGNTASEHALQVLNLNIYSYMTHLFRLADQLLVPTIGFLPNTLYCTFHSVNTDANISFFLLAFSSKLLDYSTSDLPIIIYNFEIYICIYSFNKYKSDNLLIYHSPKIKSSPLQS